MESPLTEDIFSRMTVSTLFFFNCSKITANMNVLTKNLGILFTVNYSKVPRVIEQLLSLNVLNYSLDLREQSYYFINKLKVKEFVLPFGTQIPTRYRDLAAQIEPFICFTEEG